MKYEDIQIGNWVKKHADNRWIPCQVTCEMFVQDGTIDNMRPIEITPDLLTMLGFKIGGTYAFYYKTYDYEGADCSDAIIYRLEDSLCNIRNECKKSLDGFITYHDGFVGSLHELQQLLKLCCCEPLGIDPKSLEKLLNS